MKRRIKISNNGNKIIMFDIVIVLGVKIHILPVLNPILGIDSSFMIQVVREPMAVETQSKKREFLLTQIIIIVPSLPSFTYL